MAGNDSGASFSHSNVADIDSDTEEIGNVRRPIIVGTSKNKLVIDSSSNGGSFYSSASTNQEGVSSSERFESGFFKSDDRNHSISPPPSPEPYAHPPIEAWELDIDEANDATVTQKLKTEIRKRQGKLDCVGMSSNSSAAEIQWAIKYYDQQGIWACPLSTMRPHIFNSCQNFRIPRMVTSPKLLSLGVGAPLHPYFRRILEWYDLAPIQLSLNSYKLAVALFILYKRQGFEAPSMEEFSYFFGLRRSHKGYYFLVANYKHNNKGFSEGKVSHEKKWKDWYFYLYNVPRIRTQFNTAPFVRVQDKLFGEAKERARTILNLPKGSFNLKTLVTEENLKEAGFLSKGVGSLIPYQRFRGGEPITINVKEDSSDNESNSDDMASSLPKGFGIDLGADSAAPVRTRRTRPSSKKEDSSKVTVTKGKSPKKRCSKKHKVADSSKSSLAESQLGPLVAPYVTDEDIQKWKAMESQAKVEAAVKASAQLIIYSLGCVSSVEQEKMRQKQWELEKSKLTKQLKNAEHQTQKLCDEKDAQYRVLQKEVEDQAEMLQSHNKSIDALTEENADLKIRVDDLEEDQESGWSEEKKRIKDEAFADGFRNYVSGFMAVDPDYNFSKFDEDTRKWLADFRLEKADEIKMKRIKLGIEASGDKDVNVADKVFSSP